MPDLPNTQEQKEKGQEPPKFKFGFVPASTDDKTPSKGDTATAPAPAPDFKFSFGYVPDQEPPRKSLRPHGHIDKQIADPAGDSPLKSTTESKDAKSDESPKDGTKDSSAACAFSFPGIAACKPPETTAKPVFSFPHIGPQKTDDSAQGAPATEHSASLVSTKNYTTAQSIEKKDYQNKDSLFEGGDIELYHYDKEEGRWITQNKGYLQIISVKDSPDERQLVFSRIGTSIVAINSRLSKAVDAIPDKKRYIKIPLHNDQTKTTLVALFKFATEELRDACLATMPQQDSSEKKPEECAK